MGELVKIDPSVLIDSFRKKLGDYLYQAPRDEDNETLQVRVEPRQFSRIGTHEAEHARPNRNMLNLG